MPEISVIVPVYNVEEYLSSCIDRILNQTFKDLELILIDDGCTDGCSSICAFYAQKDSRIKVACQEHQGPSGARNTGIDLARGKYICFIDSDDLVEPEYCRVLYNLLKDTSYDFSFCGTLRFQDGTNPVPEKRCDAPVIVSNADFTKMQLDRKTEFGVWNKLYRRDLFARFRFADGRLNEDVIFSADLLLHLSNGVIGTNDQLHCYRRRPGSIVALQRKKGSPDQIYAGEYLLNAVKIKAPELYEKALEYAVDFPWSFVDPIYVHGTFRENKEFLDRLQKYLHAHLDEYLQGNIFPDIQLKRMSLFARSRILYGFNAYGRLFRVYLFHLLGKDAYADGHGI